ncbi:MAG: bifunctional DNA primase/polymerase [Anaerolineae bacterium]|nr:bifunctional DNA primase/polymerase [Anaerolineae bacterium]
MMNAIQHAAVKLLERGFSVFPLAPTEKTPSRGFDLRTYQRERRATRQEVETWFGGQMGALQNIGIATGQISGVFVVDCDSELAYEKIKENGSPDTLCVATARGIHLYFSLPDFPVPCRAGLLPGVDVRGNGGYVVAPPSTHPSGKRYQWIREVPPAPAPEWLLALLKQPRPQPPAKTVRGGETIKDPAAYVAAAFDRELQALESASEGERNHTLNKAAFNLGQLVPSGLVAEFDVFRELEAAATRIGLSEAEIGATIRSGLESGKTKARTVTPPSPESIVAGERLKNAPAPSLSEAENAPNLTDVGNAHRLVGRWGDRIRYVALWKKWLVWDGTRWAQDDTHAIMRAAKDTVQGMYREASELVSDRQRQAYIKWALNSESRGRLENMIALAQSEKRVAIRPEKLDTRDWLLNCKNATVDLQSAGASGKFRTYDPDPHDLLTRRLDVVYDARAKAPHWLKFINRVMGGDQEMIAYLQRAMGYSLTGDVGEQCLFFMIGTGKNGKSTFIETLLTLMGEYAIKTPTETLMSRDRSGVPNDVARLAGKRLVVARETDESQRLAEATVKDLTGGDVIVARYLYQELFEFRPTHKLWMYGNHKPLVRGTDEGIWRRIRLIPFMETITEAERDPYLPARLRDEMPGILNWALEGCLEWQVSGLGEPAKVREATQIYRSEMDILGEFFSETCEIKASQWVTARDLYRAYSQWCDEMGERPISQRALGLRLKERGFQPERGANGTRAWKGIGFPKKVGGETPF